MDKAFFLQLTLVVTLMIIWVYLTMVSVQLSLQPQHQEGFTEQLEDRVHQLEHELKGLRHTLDTLIPLNEIRKGNMAMVLVYVNPKNTTVLGSTLDEVLPQSTKYRKWLDEKVQYCDVRQNRCTVFIELTLDALISYPYGWKSPGLNRNYLQNAVFYQKQKAVQKVFKFYGDTFPWVFFTDLDTRIVNPQINMHHFTQSTNASILIVDRKAQVPNAACFMIKNDVIGRTFIDQWVDLEIYPFFQEDNGALGFLLSTHEMQYGNTTTTMTTKNLLTNGPVLWKNIPYPGRKNRAVEAFDYSTKIRPFCVRLTSKTEVTYEEGDFMVHAKDRHDEMLNSIKKRFM